MSEKEKLPKNFVQPFVRSRAVICKGHRLKIPFFFSKGSFTSVLDERFSCSVFENYSDFYGPFPPQNSQLIPISTPPRSHILIKHGRLKLYQLALGVRSTLYSRRLRRNFNSGFGISRKFRGESFLGFSRPPNPGSRG